MDATDEVLPAGGRRGGTTYRLAGRFRRLAHVEFGPAAAPVLVCVHGLTRNGRDFDVLAASLSDRFRVICPDLPGRGRSDWLEDASLYGPGSYVAALGHLLAAIGREVMWLGTSLGGICGMMLAAEPGTPITRMVLNDIGPLIPAASLARIGQYLAAQPPGDAMRFTDLAALERHLRKVHAPFGQLSDDAWRQMAAVSARPLPAGGVALHYDPLIAEAMRVAPAQDVDLSGFWRAVRCPVLAIRGAASDLLSEAVFAAMLADGAAGYVVAEAGHAPALLDAASIAAVRAFLLPEAALAGAEADCCLHRRARQPKLAGTFQL